MQELVLNTPEEISAYKEQLAYELDTWAQFCMPDADLKPFPEIYHYAWADIITALHNTDNLVPFRFALGLPRGFVKTTFFKLIVVYAIVHRLRHFPVICGQKEERAAEFLSDVMLILLSPNITAIYEDYSKAFSAKDARDRTTKKEFRPEGSSRMIIMIALGAGTSIRGINRSLSRPDLLLLDDAQTRECAFSETENRNLISWVVLTFLKTCAPKGVVMLLIGNLYNDKCLLYLIKNNPEWTTLITGAMLEDGSAVWEDFKPLEVIESEFRNDSAMGQEEGFFAEVQNDIKPAISVLMDTRKFLYTSRREYSDYGGIFITVDPAGVHKKADNHAIVVHGYHNGYIDHIEGVCKQLKPDECILTTLDLVVKHHAGTVFIEGNAYQATLAYWMNLFKGMLGLHNLQIEPFVLGHGTKTKRIEAWARGAESGRFKVCSHELRASAIWQAHAYDTRSKENNDDLLDTLAHAPIMVARYPELMKVRQYQVPDEDWETRRDDTLRTVLDFRAFHSLQSYGYRIH